MTVLNDTPVEARRCVQCDKALPNYHMDDECSHHVYGQRLEAWTRRTEWPLSVAAILFLIAYACQVIMRPTGGWLLLTETVIWVTWVAFLVDYVVRLLIAENRKKWFTRNLFDLAIVVLPMLRPLRLMRFLTVLALVQRSAGGMLRGKVIMYSVGATLLVILISALAVLDAEAGTGNIENFGEASWWAFMTLLVGGESGYVPDSFMGRLVAAGLMTLGIVLIGSITATIASWIIEQVQSHNSPKEADQIESLQKDITELKELLTEAKKGSS